MSTTNFVSWSKSNLWPHKQSSRLALVTVHTPYDLSLVIGRIGSGGRMGRRPRKSSPACSISLCTAYPKLLTCKVFLSDGGIQRMPSQGFGPLWYCTLAVFNHPAPARAPARPTQEGKGGRGVWPTVGLRGLYRDGTEHSCSSIKSIRA